MSGDDLATTFGANSQAIGSDASNELVIDEPTVSRRHAEVIQRSGGFEIRDLGSTNGTFVNAQGVSPRAIMEQRRSRLGGFQGSTGQHTENASSLIALAILTYSSVPPSEWVRDYPARHRAPPRPTIQAKGTPVSVPSVAASVPRSASTAAASLRPSWLLLLNHYRELAHSGSVVEDPNLSRADRLHAEYLVRNFPEAIRSGGGVGAEAHREDSRRPNYTDEGALAASGSLADEWEILSRTGKERADDLSKPYLTYPPSESAAPEWNVDEWLSVPFHRPQILNPQLRRVGFGMYCASGLCAACLDTLHGASVTALPDPPAKEPIEFPPDGGQVTVRGFYADWPDPRSSCAGYNPPSGLPLTIQLGNWVSAKLQDFSVERIGSVSIPVEACAFDETTYSNPDPRQQALVREILHDFGMVVVLPRKPLEGGASYHVTTTVNGTKYDWSFSTRKP